MVAPEQLPLVPAEKQCSGPCGRLLPVEAFGRHKKAKDGLNWWCRECDGARARAYYRAHKAELIARAAQSAVVISHKRCCDCDEMQPIANFQRTRRTMDGYQSWCKACRKKYDAAHKGEKAVYDAAYRLMYAERRRSWARVWRARNAERIQSYRQRHADANRASVMRYYRANPEPFKVRANERRVRLRQIPGHFTAADVALIREVQRGLCAYCGATLAANAPIEHMTPITRAGTNWPWNLCIACRSCNQSKFTKDAGEFLALLIKRRRAQAAV